MLAKSKLNSIETLVSQALLDLEISHEEFAKIWKERNKYEKMKENVRNVSKKHETTRLNSTNSKSKKFLNNLVVKLNILFNFYIYKMHLISAEGYKSAGADMLRNWYNMGKYEKCARV